MIANNSNQLVDRLKEAFKTRGVLAQFARETSINEGTVRKWMSRNSKISYKDAITAEEWLKKYNSTETPSSQNGQEHNKYSEIEKALAGKAEEPVVQIILNLTYSSRKDADTINSLSQSRLIDSRVIAALVQERLGINLGISDAGGLRPIAQVLPDEQMDEEIGSVERQQQQRQSGTASKKNVGKQKSKGN